MISRATPLHQGYAPKTKIQHNSYHDFQGYALTPKLHLKPHPP